MSDKFDEMRNILNNSEPEKEQTKEEKTKKKFPFKKVLIAFFIFVFLGIEIEREDNYLKYKAPTTVFYINKYSDYIEISGNYLTTSFNKKDVFSLPKIVYITCDLTNKKCIENYASFFLEELIVDNKEYKIIKANKNFIEAVNYGSKFLFTLKINLTSEDVTITQEPLVEKTGDKFHDIGLRQTTTKLVGRNTWEKENLRYHYSLIDTPIYFIFSKLFKN